MGASPPILPGTPITVIVDGEARQVTVSRVADGLFWVRAQELGARQPGEAVEIEIGVRGDARYCAGARVAIAMRDHLGLRLDATWARQQGREYARVATYGQRVVLDREEEDALEELPLIDLSAGGARIAEAKELEEGDEVVCRFHLGSEAYELAARVVRVQAPTAGERRFVSLEFVSVRETERAGLIAWVNAEQVRRRLELRERSRSVHRSRSDR